MPMGRKLLPMEKPITMKDQFAWLVRLIRCTHGDPAVRNTETFSRMMSTSSGEALKPATINKLEGGTLDFSIERCIAFEEALDLNLGDLVDPYIWLCRQAEEAPRTNWSKIREVEASEIELLVRVAQEEQLPPIDWLRITSIYRNRRELFQKPRTRESFFHGLMRDYGRSYERDQRLMREALINVGEDILPYLISYIQVEPMRYFNTTEAVRYFNENIDDKHLISLAERLDDSYSATCILESIGICLRRQGRRVDTLPEVGDVLREYVSDLLENTAELFMPREAALSLVRTGQVVLTQKQSRKIKQCRDELGQLAVQPSQFNPGQLLNQISTRLSRLLQEKRLSPETPIYIPGLDLILRNGIFGRDRVGRLCMGGLLGAWQHAAEITDALGETLTDIPTEDFGVQRSMVRLVTKIGSSNANANLRRLNPRRTRDENTRLSIAWAMGSGHDPEDLTYLESLWKVAQSRPGKRAIVVAAYRRSFGNLLSEIARDRDMVIHREAITSIRGINTRS
ncbi:hypothetical protein [Amycolatopsis thailandensis]|uniref:hypothetical protein n=1 Tax=Amycolatopsis thailandensis TaxID=589330 RepID=UPI003641D340